jgi:hypothetical protein
MSHIIDLLRAGMRKGLFFLGKIYNSDTGLWENDEGLPAGHSGKQTIAIALPGGAVVTPLLPADATVRRYFTHIGVVNGPIAAAQVAFIQDNTVDIMPVGLAAPAWQEQIGNGSGVVLRTVAAVDVRQLAGSGIAFVSATYYEVPV